MPKKQYKYKEAQILKPGVGQFRSFGLEVYDTLRKNPDDDYIEEGLVGQPARWSQEDVSVTTNGLMIKINLGFKSWCLEILTTQQH